MMHWWKQPLAGDIVWCRFPVDLQKHSGSKARPALILKVYDDHAPQFSVLVAYGTSQKLTTLYKGEFAITHSQGEAFRTAGLSYDTKFNLANRIDLPFNDEYFAISPRAPYGQQPKIGVLHPSLMKTAAAAFAMV